MNPENNCGTVLYTVVHKDYPYRVPERSYIGVGGNRAIPGVTLYDNTGDEIAARNPSFCELTALYWIWKNSDADYVGLEHYRRFFYHKFRSVRRYRFYTKAELLHLMQRYDLILPEKSYMKMKHGGRTVRTVAEHFASYHHEKDLAVMREIIAEAAPDCLSAFDRVMKGRKLHLFNMFFTSKAVIDDYCAWLFPLLFEAERRIDISGYDTQQTRLFGFLSERLFNVWVLVHPELRVKYLAVGNPETPAPRAFLKKIGRIFAFWRA